MTAVNWRGAAGLGETAGAGSAMEPGCPLMSTVVELESRRAQARLQLPSCPEQTPSGKREVLLEGVATTEIRCLGDGRGRAAREPDTPKAHLRVPERGGWWHLGSSELHRQE